MDIFKFLKIIKSNNSDITIKFDESDSAEWLETNGLGGYSSSTLSNCNKRKYHGLLVSNLENLDGKFVLLSKIEDTINIGEKKFLLSASQYPGTFLEGSIKNLSSFNLNPNPTFTFKFDDIFVEKSILMINGKNTILVRYKTNAENPTELTIRPLMAYRNYHDLAKENFNVNFNVTDIKNGKFISPYTEMPSMFFQTDNNFEFINDPLWYKNLEYLKELERGYPFQEDLFSPGIFKIYFNKNAEIIFCCSLNEEKNISSIWENEIYKRKKEEDKIKGSDLKKHLQKAGKSFFQKSEKDGTLSVVAGYHWFLSWGRDTMISLPGLTLFSDSTSEYHDICLKVLHRYAVAEKDGLIPNFLGNTATQNAYNSVDSSLWFAWTIQCYLKKTGNHKAIKEFLWPTLKNIVKCYINGTFNDIKMNENGLLYAGNASTNLTWMDAVVDGMPVIKRYGAIIEINALWYNTICFIKELSILFKEKDLEKQMSEIIENFKKSFLPTFWNDSLGYLKDVVNSDFEDNSLRPNQLFAISLPYSPIENDIKKQIFDAISNNLLTPFGLRTLSTYDSGYIGKYAGDQKTRDQSYHNGTVWPWLLGPFADALLRVNSDRQYTSNMIKDCISKFDIHIKEYGVGSIAEIFDGDFPHCPNGCISQAWSVSEILRLADLV